MPQLERFPAHPEFSDMGQLVLEVQASDVAGAKASLTFTVAVTDPPGVVIAGGVGDDRLIALSGHETLSGGAGEDTAVFQGSVSDYVGTSFGSGHARIVSKAGVVYTLVDVEHLSFVSGSIDVPRVAGLVDPVFYFTHRQSTFVAEHSATALYDLYGWREGSDPDAFFSTRGY